MCRNISTLSQHYFCTFRLLTEYHSFLYLLNCSNHVLGLNQLSVSLRSITHSYNSMESFIANIIRDFPSPYGVSLILIYIDDNDYSILGHELSVSLRSITHSYYLFLNDSSSSIDTTLSVSLRSITHSYQMQVI